MEKIHDQSKSLSPSRSPSTSRKSSGCSSLKFEFDHPSPKSPSDTQPIPSHNSHQASPEVQSLIEKLERVSIISEKHETSQSFEISVSSSLQPR